ncbi:NHL repeat protein [Leptospira broomii serovar Hurstbridge str. 5399]|uniref:NHL repeat protein n=1 Tax=Leptospira broomii serovar Hurstbridge str. 5399 TaxID=1049789 RepID=T0F0G0_9LEPT|nr:NHL repeat-containing protein [Leptospira broomii]EQA44620.1 NHL repeat protein [Leptospira broomii serovar Hurstbridge str. 5399]
MNQFKPLALILVALIIALSCKPRHDNKDNLLVALLAASATQSNCTTTPVLTLGESATLVLGQSGFTMSASGTAQNQFKQPSGIAVDSKGGQWISDATNNRVLHFPNGVATGGNADVVLGQSNFTSSGPGTTQSTLTTPQGLAVDSNGGLWVVDSGNHRVLHFPSGVATGGNADLVIGQANYTSGTNATTQSRLSSPHAVAIDSAGGIWISDGGNNRALHFPSGIASGGNADLVLGQSNYTSGTGGVTAQNALNDPRGLAVDLNGGIWIVEYANNRALHFPNGTASGGNADRVLGQINYTSSAGQFTRTQISLYQPQGIAVDSNGGIWVGDTGNLRVLHYANGVANGGGADKVLGQSDYTNIGKTGPTADSVGAAAVLALSSCGQLWVGDTTNTRVLYFP